MLFRMICVVYCSLKGSLRFVAACEALSFLVAPNFKQENEKKKADLHIEGHKKRITAGLLASAKFFARGPNILATTQEWKKRQDDDIYKRSKKVTRIFNP